MQSISLLSLLQSAVLAILLILATVVAYTLAAPQHLPSGEVQARSDMPIAFGQDSLVRIGKQLWRENTCGSCHNNNMQDALIGPALAGVTERWAPYPRSDLYNWVRQSGRLIDDGHPRALQLWQEYGPQAMNDYAHLADEEIVAILSYIEARTLE